MENLEIRKATLKDIPKIMEMQETMLEDERKYMRSLVRKGRMVSYPKKEIKEIITSPNCYFTIAEINKKPIGCGFARIEKAHEDWYKYSKLGYLGLLYVKKEFRRRGIAKALQEERIKWLKSKGIKMVVNKIIAKNRPSLNLQRKQGFKPYIIKMYKII